MMVLKAVLLASLIFSSLAMGDDPISENCEQNTSQQPTTPLDGIAPNCLANRPVSQTGNEFLQNDLRVCECIDRSPVASLIQPRTNPEPRPEPQFGTTDEFNEFSAVEIHPSRINQDCVTFMEFSSHRQMPFDNAFFTSIPSGPFDLNDWNLSSLSTQYDLATARSREGIEARMNFLVKNPSIRYLMEPGQSSSSPNLLRRQSEVFEMIKSLAPSPGSTCSTIPNECWEELNRSGAYRRFRENLARLMDEREAEVQSETPEVVSIPESRRENTPLLDTPEDFLIDLGPDLQFGCAGTNASADCYELFPQHCLKIRTTLANMARNPFLSGRSISNRIEVQERQDGRMEGYARFNNMICNTPYQNASGESANFFQFRAQKCPGGNNNSPACNDRHQLLAMFFSEFPRPDNETTFARSSFVRSLSSDPVSIAVEARLYSVNRIASISHDRFSNSSRGYPAIPNARLQSIITAANNFSSVQSKLSASSRSTLSSSPGLVSPVKPIGQSSAVGTERSRFNSERSDLSNNIPTSYRSSALRELTRPIDYVPSSEEEIPFRRPAETRIRNTQLAENNSQQTVVPQRAELSRPQFSGGQAQIAPSSGSGNRRANSGGGGSSLSPGAPATPQVSSSGGRRSIIEVSPRRGSGSRSGRSPASGNDDQTTTVNTDIRPVIPVEVNQAILTSALTDPQILANDRGIMERVNSSAEQVVRLALRVAGSNEDTVVYAIKESGGVRFSLTPLSETVPANAQILRPNEMNLRVVDQTSFTDISRDPASLLANTELINTARTIEGGIIRMNIISPTGQTSVIYLDKRTDQLRILTRAPR